MQVRGHFDGLFAIVDRGDRKRIMATADVVRWLSQDEATGRCLDGNGGGGMYTSPCDGNNSYENWRLNTDSATTIQSFATGRCLDSNAAGNAYSSPCDGNNSYEIWD